MKIEKIIEQLKWLYDAIETPEDAECLPELRHDTANKALQQAIDILEVTNDRTVINEILLDKLIEISQQIGYAHVLPEDDPIMIKAKKKQNELKNKLLSRADQS